MLKVTRCKFVHNLPCEQVSNRLTELEAENDKLHERLKASDDGRKRQADNLIDKYHKIAQLQTDNAKLRGLVQDFDKCLTEAVRLAYIQGHATIYDGTLLDSLHPRMRELGIEVEG